MKRFVLLLAFLLPLLAFAQEQILQGVFYNYGQLAYCKLRYVQGNVMNIATTKDMVGNYEWKSIQPDNPHPTHTTVDGNIAREYSHYISVQGSKIYFNLPSTSGFSSNSSFSNQMSNESIIQGSFIYNGQQNRVFLRYVQGNVMNYATRKDDLGNYDWQTMYPDNPHPTNSMEDRGMADAYKYKVRAGQTTFYFNM